MLPTNDGYFKVGDRIHAGKIAALIDGTERNIHPEWHFHSEVFNAVDWTTEPPLPIQHYYAERARAIREKYSYVVLMYSGGADSQTVLDSFLNNGIKVDEILVSWASSIKYEANPNDFKFENTLSEWDYTIRPRLHQLSQTHPEIKITIHDWTAGIDKIQIADDYIVDCNINVAPFGRRRWDYSNIESIQRAVERHQNVGIVWGTDKPRVCINDGHYCLYFLDIVAQQFSNDPMNRTFTEFFYWHPDCTALLAKQAHLIAGFFENNPRLKHYIQWPTGNPAYRQFYENVVRAIIYPDFDLATFQVNKTLDPNIQADMFLFSASEELKNLIIRTDRQNFDYLQTVIDPKYFRHTAGITSLTGFISPMYCVRTA